jgi:uncharacterized protein (TIGR02391 family)
MPKRQLDDDLLDKLRARTGKSKQYLREQISRKAGKLGVSSLAAQLIWATQERIGVTHALNKARPEVREEVRSAKGPSPVRGAGRLAVALSRKSGPKKKEPITRATIDTLLQDQQLRDRCRDLLLAKKHFDRAFREATTVLDDRLKKKSGIKNLNPLSLVGKAVNPDPQKAVTEVSAEKDEQEGFYGICKGVMLAFRNKSHHELSDKFTREDALKFCGFIDAILGIVEQANLHPERL